MSRKHRVWFPGAMYHITARGNRRSALFEEQKDYSTYLSIVEKVRNQFPFHLHSYCLMTNHIHLQLETTTFHITQIMKGIHTSYAVKFNRKYDYVGHVFQGRFSAKLINDDAHFLEVSRYIHLNPLEAKMVEKPQDYRWSSYCTYLSSQEDPHAIVTTTKILSYFPEPKVTNYQHYVEAKIKE